MSNLAGSVRELLAGDALDQAEEAIASLSGASPPSATAHGDSPSDRDVDVLLDASSNLREAARVGVGYLTGREPDVASSLRLLERLLPLDATVAAMAADSVCAHLFDPGLGGPVTGERPLFATVVGVIAASVERDSLAGMWLEVGQIEAEQGGHENSVVTFLRACRFVRGALRARG